METQRTKVKYRVEPADPASLERGVRQLLADKISGALVGIWLLVPEYLRLGIWDLLCGWTGKAGERIEPRLGLQLVNEAALCVTRIRANSSLSQKGFEVANGLPFLASDTAIHELLAARTIADTEELQVALGRLRRASGHFQGRLLAVDPHHLHSSSKRQMRRRRPKPELPAEKTSQSLFCVDTDTWQPVCFVLSSSSRSVAQEVPRLLTLTQDILVPKPGQALLLADSEHFGKELFGHVAADTPFDLLAPQPAYPVYRRQLQQLPPEAFTHRWAGLATAKTPLGFGKHGEQPYTRIVQRTGERPGQFQLKAFVCTSDREEVQALCEEYPSRWHAEEFFNANQGLGWRRAGTMNLNIRYGKMTAALLAQAGIHQLRQRLGHPMAGWNAEHLGESLFRGLDGDIRVHQDTILVTFYDAAPLADVAHLFTELPARLESEGVNPRIPWLNNLKLDFRFR